jgi:hypothetical protein
MGCGRAAKGSRVSFALACVNGVCNNSPHLTKTHRKQIGEYLSSYV